MVHVHITILTVKILVDFCIVNSYCLTYPKGPPWILPLELSNFPMN